MGINLGLKVNVYWLHSWLNGKSSILPPGWRQSYLRVNHLFLLTRKLLVHELLTLLVIK